jgi:hypothetical protein
VCFFCDVLVELAGWFCSWISIPLATDLIRLLVAAFWRLSQPKYCSYDDVDDGDDDDDDDHHHEVPSLPNLQFLMQYVLYGVSFLKITCEHVVLTDVAVIFCSNAL